MAALKDFLSARRKTLTDALAPLLDQRVQLEAKIHKLRKELNEVDQAARAIGIDDRAPELELIAQHRQRPSRTIKQAVVEILADHPNGLSALDILAKINNRHDLGIVRTSLSPQLSRLKNEERIVNDHTVWRLVPTKTGAVRCQPVAV